MVSFFRIALFVLVILICSLPSLSLQASIVIALQRCRSEAAVARGVLHTPSGSNDASNKSHDVERLIALCITFSIDVAAVI